MKNRGEKFKDTLITSGATGEEIKEFNKGKEKIGAEAGEAKKESVRLKKQLEEMIEIEQDPSKKR